MGMFHCFQLLPFLLLSTSPWVYTAIASASGETVSLSVYYEALCPFCADFIVNHLVKVFQGGLLSIVRLRLVPFGNTETASDGSYNCQHGSNECFLNTIDACTISIYPDVVQHFRFIYCLERLTLQNKSNRWMTCFASSGLKATPVTCYNSGLGKKLEDYYAAETSRLDPPQRFVPWVTVNGQALEEDFENFVWYVCNAYKGRSVPDACRFPAKENMKLKTEHKSNASVCFLKKPNNPSIPNKVNILPNSTN